MIDSSNFDDLFALEVTPLHPLNKSCLSTRAKILSARPPSNTHVKYVAVVSWSPVVATCIRHRQHPDMGISVWLPLAQARGGLKTRLPWTTVFALWLHRCRMLSKHFHNEKYRVAYRTVKVRECLRHPCWNIRAILEQKCSQPVRAPLRPMGILTYFFSDWPRVFMTSWNSICI